MHSVNELANGLQGVMKNHISWLLITIVNDLVRSLGVHFKLPTVSINFTGSPY